MGFVICGGRINYNLMIGKATGILEEVKKSNKKREKNHFLMILTQWLYSLDLKSIKD